MANQDLMIFIRLIREINNSVRKEWNFLISGPQLQLLELLHKQGPMRMSDLADKLDVTLGAITSLADRMIKGSYVIRERSEEDRRVVNLKLTPEGKDLLNTFSESRNVAIERFLCNLTPEEKEEMIRLCSKMLDF